MVFLILLAKTFRRPTNLCEGKLTRENIGNPCSRWAVIRVQAMMAIQRILCHLLDALNLAFVQGQLLSSQRQAMINFN